MCTKIEVLVETFVKNSKLESQETELVATSQDRYDATFAGFLFQDRDVMIEKKTLQLMKLWTCTATVVIAWSVQNQETGQESLHRITSTSGTNWDHCLLYFGYRLFFS